MKNKKQIKKQPIDRSAVLRKTFPGEDGVLIARNHATGQVSIHASCQEVTVIGLIELAKILMRMDIQRRDVAGM